MINGDVNDFLDTLWVGEEVIFTYNGKKYFAQGYTRDDNVSVHEVQLWEPEAKVIWQEEGGSAEERILYFQNAQIFDGKSFLEIEREIEWVDE